jgi:hypothetical protein
LLLAIALVPSIDAVIRLGRLHPDEVFQALEPAMRAAFGSGPVAWEWNVGLRNWFVPGLFGLILTGAHGVGVDDPLARRALLEVPQFALNLAMVLSVFRFSQRRIGPGASRWAVLLLLSWGPWVWFAGRTMGESMSAALLVMALERLDDEQLSEPGARLAGVLLGFAEITRYGSAAFILPVLVYLAVRRRWPVLRGTLVGGAVMAVLLGVLDRLTWGHWFHSLAEYLRFNLFTGGASSFGRMPPWWYLARLYLTPVAALGLLNRNAALRSGVFMSAVLTYVVAISVTEHKEIRFIYPALVLALVAGAPGFISFVRDAKPPLRVAALIAAAAASLGLYLVKSPYDVERTDLFHATLEAGRTGSGVVLINEGVWGSGGTFYLGKDLPFAAVTEPDELATALQDPRINRGLWVVEGAEPDARFTTALTAAGFRQTKRIGDIAYVQRP